MEAAEAPAVSLTALRLVERLLAAGATAAKGESAASRMEPPGGGSWRRKRKARNLARLLERAV